MESNVHNDYFRQGLRFYELKYNILFVDLYTKIYKYLTLSRLELTILCKNNSIRVILCNKSIELGFTISLYYIFADKISCLHLEQVASTDVKLLIAN